MARTGWVAPTLAAAAVVALATCAVLGLSSPDSSPYELAMANTAPAVATQPAAFQAPATRAMLVAAPGNMGVGQGKAGTAGTPNPPAQAAPTPATPATAPTPPTPAAKKVRLSQAIQMTENSANKALARASKQAVQAALLQAALSVPGQRTAEKAAAKRAAVAAANKPSAAWLAGQRALGNRDPYEPIVQKSVDASAKLAAKRRQAASRLKALKMGRSGSMALAHGAHEEEEVERRREEEEDREREEEKHHKLPYKIVKGHHKDDVYLKYHHDEEGKDGEDEEEEKYVDGTRELGTPVKKEDVKDEWMEGAHNPGFFIHPRDRYVKVGGIIHPPSDDDEEEEDAEEGEREQQEGEGEHENEGEEHREERARTIQQLSAGGSLNSPNAPTLEGGVSVPGGRVVWLPLNQLSAGAAPASSLAPSAQTVPVAPQQIPMPQMPAMYSKVVAYGPDGKPDAVWYGSGQWQPEGGSARQMKQSRGRQQQLSMAEHGRRKGAAVGSDGLTAADRAIERKVLFHLLKEEQLGSSTSGAGERTAMSLLLPVALMLVVGVSHGGWW